MVSVSHQARDEVLYRQYDYGDETVVVVDLGADVEDESVEIVDGTAIVVVHDEQHAISVPNGVDRAVMNNGAVRIEVER